MITVTDTVIMKKLEDQEDIYFGWIQSSLKILQ